MNHKHTYKHTGSWRGDRPNSIKYHDFLCRVCRVRFTVTDDRFWGTDVARLQAQREYLLRAFYSAHRNGLSRAYIEELQDELTTVEKLLELSGIRE